MKTMCKGLATFIFALLLSFVMPMEANAVTSGDWEYSILTYDNKEYAQIKGYTGADASVTVPSKLGGKSVKYISDYAFSQNKYIVKVHIPNSVTDIGEFAFSNCPNLTTVTGAVNVESVDWGAFEYCEKLTSYPFTENLTYIGREAFRNTALKSISISTKPYSIEGSAFEGCNGLTSLVIPDGGVVGRGSFKDCDNLTTVKIGAITSREETYAFSDGMFEGCDSLTTAEVMPGNRTLYDEMFKDCISLTSVSIPNSVRDIEGAFEGCTKLLDLSIPYGVLSISVFSHSVQTIDLPNSVVSFWGNLSGSTTQTIRFPKSVTGIYLFGYEGVVECYAGSAADEYLKSINNKNDNEFTIKYLTDIPSTSLTIGSTQLSLLEGEETAIKFSTAPTNNNDAVVWESTNEKVATVNGMGEVVALAEGNTTIVATTSSGISKQVKVSVSKPVLKYKKTSIALLKGDFISNKANVYHGKNVRTGITVTYESSNSSVAAVDKDGTIKATGTGTTTITARYNDQYAYCSVKVVKKLSKPKISLKRAGSKKMKIKWGKVTAAEGYQIQYSTSSKFKNKKTVTISSGTKTSSTIKKLKKNKKYYVRMRAYAKVGSKTKYSSWSSKKYIIVK